MKKKNDKPNEHWGRDIGDSMCCIALFVAVGFGAETLYGLFVDEPAPAYSILLIWWMVPGAVALAHERWARAAPVELRPKKYFGPWLLRDGLALVAWPFFFVRTRRWNARGRPGETQRYESETQASNETAERTFLFDYCLSALCVFPYFLIVLTAEVALGLFTDVFSGNLHTAVIGWTMTGAAFLARAKWSRAGPMKPGRGTRGMLRWMLSDGMALLIWPWVLQRARARQAQSRQAQD